MNSNNEPIAYGDVLSVELWENIFTHIGSGMEVAPLMRVCMRWRNLLKAHAVRARMFDAWYGTQPPGEAVEFEDYHFRIGGVGDIIERVRIELYRSYGFGDEFASIQIISTRDRAEEQPSGLYIEDELIRHLMCWDRVKRDRYARPIQNQSHMTKSTALFIISMTAFFASACVNDNVNVIRLLLHHSDDLLFGRGRYAFLTILFDTIGVYGAANILNYLREIQWYQPYHIDAIKRAFDHAHMEILEHLRHCSHAHNKNWMWCALKNKYTIQERRDVIRMIMQMDVELRNSYNIEIIHETIRLGDLEIIRAVLDKHFPCRHRCYPIVLKLALMQMDSDVVKLVLDFGLSKGYLSFGDLRACLKLGRHTKCVLGRMMRQCVFYFDIFAVCVVLYFMYVYCF